MDRDRPRDTGSSAAADWQRLSIGDGVQGPRVYDWAASRFGRPTAGGLVHWLLIRRSVTDPDDRAYYLGLTPKGTTAHDLAYAAGRRWALETCFECAQQEAGLDEYEVRSWVGWYRHATLSLLALAFLTAVRAEANLPRLTSIERAPVWSDWRRHHQALARAARYRRTINTQL